jgi:hypothetical protein
MFDDGDVFYRIHYSKRMLGRATIDLESMRVIHDYGYVCIGEDPRVLKFGSRKIVVDNYLNDVHIIFPDEGYRRIKVPFEGKNFTFFSDDVYIYCATWLAPLTVWRSTDAIVWEPIVSKSKQGENGSSNASYRGGTTGLRVDYNRWVGYGHETVNCNTRLLHTPFAWAVHIIDNTAYIDIGPPLRMDGMRTITDPVCLVYRDGNVEMITAESDNPWFRDQTYDCKIYNLNL